MPTLRSSKSGQGLQAPVSPPKGTRKVQKGRTVKSKVAKTIKVNNLLSMVPNTAEDSDVSTVPLPSLPSLSSFGSITEDSYPLTGYVAQATRLFDRITPPKSFSGDKKDWPYFTAMFENYVQNQHRIP